jgi:predicted phage terminase large subunit-like protein
LPTLAEVRAEIRRREIERERERIARDAEAIRAKCSSLAGFVKEAWQILEPNARIVWNWHLDAFCDHLQAVTDGRLNRLLINVPPGSSKSLVVSVFWQAWEWTDPARASLRYLTTGHNDVPVKRDTRKCRDLILSEWYRQLWPHIRLTRTGELSFANDRTGTREGVAFGSLTSQRGDRLIIDDPHSVRTADSDAEREATTRIFVEGALNRLNDQAKSAIVVIMQRLHPEDLSGVILSRGMGYTHLRLPMRFEADARCETAIGFRDPRSFDGELLDAARFPAFEVDKLEREMGSYAFAGQYQQRPTPRAGGLFKRHWFDVVDAVPAGTNRRVRRWDLAATRKAAGSHDPDWTVGLRLAKAADGTFFIEDVVRLRGDASEVERAIKSTAAQDGRLVPVYIPQDPGQAGKMQAKYLVTQLSGYRVRAEPETGSKITRADPVAAQAAVGNIKLLRGQWNAAFLDEISMFPAGHDDQVDALSGAFAALLNGARGSLLDVL